LKVAVTVVSAPSVIVQPPVPEQPPPDHPANTDPTVGFAVNLTAVPVAYAVVQVAPHVIAPSPLPTVPEPVPAFATVSVSVLVTVSSACSACC
jgi:hypothetical protein